MAIERSEIMKIFRDTGVLMNGHFQLTSGLHSDTYLQCAQVLQYPEYTSYFCENLAASFQEKKIDVVVGPALGGVVLAYEMARVLKCRSIFSEKRKGKMPLRRGFALSEGERVLITEDVVTSGGSVFKVMDMVKSFGAEVVGVTALVDRSGSSVDFGVPTVYLVELQVEVYQPEECPLCQKGIPVIKPGSEEEKK